jgi:hypothetical protein
MALLRGVDSEWFVGKQEVRAEQRVVQEGSSPSGARMRGAISKSGGNSSLAEESRRYADA